MCSAYWFCIVMTQNLMIGSSSDGILPLTLKYSFVHIKSAVEYYALKESISHNLFMMVYNCSLVGIGQSDI